MKEMVFALSRVSIDSDGHKFCSVSEEQCEHQRVACNRTVKELGVAKAEGWKVGKYPKGSERHKLQEKGMD